MTPRASFADGGASSPQIAAAIAAAVQAFLEDEADSLSAARPARRTGVSAWRVAARSPLAVHAAYRGFQPGVPWRGRD